MNESSSPILPGTQSRRVRASANGADYEIRVWCPPAAADGRALPVIYVLDGRDFFCTFVEAVARASRRPDATAVDPAIVVGIARAAAEEGSTDGRHEDYTDGPPAEEPVEGRLLGGAGAFLSFLETELVPAIESEFPADPARRILFGHSLAGYFVLHVLATHPRSFATYLSVSPSIWWNEAALNRGVRRLDSSSGRVFVAVGEWEGELPPWQRDHPAAVRMIERRERRGMIVRAQRFAAELGRAIGSENVAFHLFPDEDHASVVLVALGRALRFALRADEARGVRATRETRP